MNHNFKYRPATCENNNLNIAHWRKREGFIELDDGYRCTAEWYDVERSELSSINYYVRLCRFVHGHDMLNIVWHKEIYNYQWLKVHEQLQEPQLGSKKFGSCLVRISQVQIANNR